MTPSGIRQLPHFRVGFAPEQLLRELGCARAQREAAAQSTVIGWRAIRVNPIERGDRDAQADTSAERGSRAPTAPAGRQKWMAVAATPRPSPSTKGNAFQNQQGDQLMAATLRLTHKAIGADVRRGTTA